MSNAAPNAEAMTGEQEASGRSQLPIPNGRHGVAVFADLGNGALTRAHCFGQELVVFRTESGVDSAHSRFVHGTQKVPITEAEEDGAYRRAFSPIEMKTPRGDVSGGIDASQAGMGFSPTRSTRICETREWATTTPVDAEHVHVGSAFVQPKVDGKDPVGGVAAAIIRDIVKQMNEDVPIWENKAYWSRPALCDGDGPVADFRRWCKQFYPE